MFQISISPLEAAKSFLNGRNNFDLGEGIENLPDVWIDAENYSGKNELAQDVIIHLDQGETVGIMPEKSYGMNERSNKRISVREMLCEEPVKNHYDELDHPDNKEYVVIRK